MPGGGVVRGRPRTVRRALLCLHLYPALGTADRPMKPSTPKTPPHAIITFNEDSWTKIWQPKYKETCPLHVSLVDGVIDYLWYVS